MHHTTLRDTLFAVEDQTKRILDVLGTPSSSELDWITNTNAKLFVENHKVPGQKWCDLLPKAHPDALDLLSKLLQFDPKKRMSAEEALKHPFLSPCRDAKTEVCRLHMS